MEVVHVWRESGVKIIRNIICPKKYCWQIIHFQSFFDFSKKKE